VRVDLDQTGWPAEAVLELEPLRPRPLDPDAWRAATLARAGGPGPSRPGATVTGFAMEVVESGTALVAFYAFIDHVGVAIVRFPDAAALAAHREAVIARLATARPDWRGPEIAYLAQLWET
jgi:hypothetical protein